MSHILSDSSVPVLVNRSGPSMAAEEVHLIPLFNDDPFHPALPSVSENCFHSFEGLVMIWTGFGGASADWGA